MPARRFCFVLLIAGTLAAACSSSSATPGPGEAYGDYGAPATAAPALLEPTAFGAIPAASAASGSESGVANASGAAPAGSFNAASPESQIVKTGTISIQVADIDGSVARATDEIHALSGWLAGSDRTTSTAQDMASATYRIPANRFEDALTAMRALGTKVLSEHTESTPVGGQIVDLQARIANLKASEKAIQAIMDKATTIADVLAVEQRLAEVQGQIEELSGQLAALTDQATYSTLTVVFVVPVVPTPSPSETPWPSPSPTATPIPWSAGDQAGQAAGALGEAGKAAATVVIWVAILIVPVTVAAILLLALFGLVVRFLDPYRKRLLPFTVAVPVNFAQPPMQAPGQTVPGPSGPRPEDTPKT